MQDHIGMGVLAQVDLTMAGRREIAQDAYDAYEFDADVVASRVGSGFFFSFHKQQPVMARRIHVLPGNGDAPVSAFFCVAFDGDSLRIKEAFAFTGSDGYFGHMPEGFIDVPEEESDLPRMLM
ncbi:hypothetical protein G6L37_05470 [Agrobacterium rubi]|nr:hypothetical protein [Agrobacterium rubi]NTF24807.1 hypothetical protein [Agrobacterium rubi]